MDFAIVEFTDDKSVAVVATNWLSQDDGGCDRPVYQQTDHVTTTGPSASSRARSKVKKEALLWKTLCDTNVEFY